MFELAFDNASHVLRVRRGHATGEINERRGLLLSGYSEGDPPMLGDTFRPRKGPEHTILKNRFDRLRHQAQSYQIAAAERQKYSNRPFLVRGRISRVLNELEEMTLRIGSQLRAAPFWCRGIILFSIRVLHY